MEQITSEMKSILQDVNDTLVQTGFMNAQIHADNEYVDEIVHRAQKRMQLTRANSENPDDEAPTYTQEISRQIGIWWDNYRETMGEEWPIAVSNTIDAYQQSHPNVEHSAFLTIKRAEGDLANYVHFRFDVRDINTYQGLFQHINVYLSAFKMAIDQEGGKFVEDEFIFFINRVFPVMVLSMKVNRQDSTPQYAGDM